DADKDLANFEKHGIDFFTAALAFRDPSRIIAVDEGHSKSEPRYFCIGKVGREIVTVRFTNRGQKIRIIGAGFWRKGRKLYEEETK
ncbi:MAG: hypothetical protein JWQ35_1627, partial [Bacteriovoracaceae bacterium]|nr:hypothetical protein [Bacteriovoracaceae bacterium]